MKSSPFRGTSRNRRAFVLAAVQALALLLFLGLVFSGGNTVSVADDSHGRHTPTLVKQQQEQGLLDPNTSGTWDHDSTHADNSAEKAPAQRQADARSLLDVGRALPGDLPAAVGGRISYMPQLPAGFYPIHETVMARGILLTAGSGNDLKRHQGHMYLTYYCNFDGAGCQKVASPPNDDLFCGDVAKPRPNLAAMMGGTLQYGDKGWRGGRKVYFFDENAKVKAWRYAGYMLSGRRYPKSLLLSKNIVLNASGINEIGKLATRAETFNISTRRAAYTPGYKNWPLYAALWRTHRAAQVVFLGAGTSNVGKVPPGLWTPSTNKFTRLYGLRDLTKRYSAATCPIDDYSKQRYIVAGGATSAIDKIDLKAKHPKFTAAGNLPGPAIYLACTSLPGGGVILAGGGAANKIANANHWVIYIPYYGARPQRLNNLPGVEHFLYHNLAVLGKGKRCAGGVVLQGSNPSGEPRNTHVVCIMPPKQLGPKPSTPKVPTTVKRGAKKVRVYVSKNTHHLAVRVDDNVTHDVNNGGMHVDVPIKKKGSKRYADFRKVTGALIPEDGGLQVYAVSKTGAYSAFPKAVNFR